MALIEIRDLRKTYDAGEVQVRALRGVSLCVEQGTSLAIMGTSGSGKSTLMNLLGCLDRPTGGSYLLDGVDVARLSRDDLADIRNRVICTHFALRQISKLPRADNIAFRINT